MISLTTSSILVGFFFVALVYAMTIMTTPTTQQASSEKIKLYPDPVQPPHSNTTTPAPGYTSNGGNSGNNNYYYKTETLPIGCTSLDRSNTKHRQSEAPDQCRPGEDKIGFSCFTRCPEKSKSHPEFPDTCTRCRDFSDSCEFMDMIVHKRTKTGTAVFCKPGYEKLGGLCFSRCPKGYFAESDLCIKCN